MFDALLSLFRVVGTLRASAKGAFRRPDFDLTALPASRVLRLALVLLTAWVWTLAGSGFAVTGAVSIWVADGFRVELVHAVDAAKEGSWVVLATDPQGRLISSDQYGKLFRITVPNDLANETASVEPLAIDLGHAQGLLHAFGSLYVMVNDGDRSGLYRAAYDAEHDRYGEPRQLLSIDGDGEHGPHTILPSADGQNLVICAGNHTALPQLTGSRVPQVWGEDQLLRRVWDPNGHAVGKLAPGGWVCEVSPDGKQCELLAIGFRNEYDCARNADGELFTYDADMEWDMGTSWYRPTRILHVTSGAEFGWRGGCYKWPDYTPDSLPAAVDMGPGSPTGITFGDGANFPDKYQQALFACDWGRGVMHAVHLTPVGSSYKGVAEPFVSANALPFTDVIVNRHDGALYFTTGGRGADSGLYRVTHLARSGLELSDPAGHQSGDSGGKHHDINDVKTDSNSLFRLRKKVEQFHAKPAAGNDLDFVWSQLAHTDRRIRYAARVALEHADSGDWSSRIDSAPDLSTRLAALLAVVRVAPKLPTNFVTMMQSCKFEQLNQQQWILLIRICELAEVRHPSALELGDEFKQAISKQFPTGHDSVDRQLVKLLAHWDAENVVERCLQLIDLVSEPSGKMHYLLALQNSSTAWTTDQVRQYLEFCAACKAGSGGKSYGGYVDDMVEWVEQRLDKEQSTALRESLALAKKQPAAFPSDVQRTFVREWALDELIRHVASGNIDPDNGDRVAGKRLFQEVHCAKCHRVNELGGAIGPDLTTSGKRFSAADLLRAMVEPDAMVSDQYRYSIFELLDGKVIVGRVTDQSKDVLKIRTDMYNPGLLERIDVDQVESQRPSTTSPMPSKLLDTLTTTEIQDLLAFLIQPSSE